MGLPAFFVSNYKEQSNLWGKEELLAMQELIEEFDIMAKSTGLKSHSLTSVLLIKATAIYGKRMGSKSLDSILL